MYIRLLVNVRPVEIGAVHGRFMADLVLGKSVVPRACVGRASIFLAGDRGAKQLQFRPFWMKI